MITVRTTKAYFIVAISSLLFGCAHSTMRGSVAMKVSDTEAHVCMDNDEVKPGDKVILFRNKCPGSVRGRNGAICQKERLGEGVVTQILNEHYSVVQFDKGVEFGEGSFVEKQ